MWDQAINIAGTKFGICFNFAFSLQIFECENDSSIGDFDETRISGLIASWRQFAIVGSVFHVRMDIFVV